LIRARRHDHAQHRILLDQIDRDIRGRSRPISRDHRRDVRRARPVVLTALAAILGMIARESIFWGPMAITSWAAVRRDRADLAGRAGALTPLVRVRSDETWILHRASEQWSNSAESWTDPDRRGIEPQKRDELG